MDGWEVTRLLRRIPSTRHIPIIALTAHLWSATGRRRLCRLDDYDTKPVDFGAERKDRRTCYSKETIMNPRPNRLLHRR